MAGKDKAPANPNRRRLLKAAPLAGAGLAVGTLPAVADEAPQDPRKVHYRETGHVKAYYARARG